MSEHEAPSETLRALEGVAAHGYLLNAISHELNNLLTNLMLGADQLKGGEGDESVAMLLDQVQRMTEVTRSIQQIGQRNLVGGLEEVELEHLMQRFAQWRAEVAPSDPLTLHDEPGARVRVPVRHMVHALSLLAQATEGAGPLELHGGKELCPRSAWARAELVPMAVLRLRRGAPPEEGSASFKELVDGFFGAERGLREVQIMAAWEVIRKQRGRVQLRGGAAGQGVEVSIQLPLVEGA